MEDDDENEDDYVGKAQVNTEKFMKISVLNRLSGWKPRAANPAIRERLFERRQMATGPWVSTGLLRGLAPVAASVMVSLAAFHDIPAPTPTHLQELDNARLASTNLASAGLLAQVRPVTLEWNRLALATLASTNPARSFSSNGSFWTLSTNIFAR
ncbi:MAG: hypothetical protein K0Q55_1925 [Verrucomicrobia bacterium]|jgi:hypothetical protein|nr:hypothetical protein [Verrucomicrobiota bacterium]